MSARASQALPPRGATGYAGAAYARAFTEFGRPRALPRSGGWLLERAVPAAPSRNDAMGAYPLFSCPRWEGLGPDLDALEGRLLSVALVTDPFGAYGRELLAAVFPDLMRPYKEHFTVDLRGPLFADLPVHHRRNLRRAGREVAVEVCAEPHRHIDEWTRLYGTLIARHRIRGMAAFSRPSFLAQLQVPGMVALRAREGGVTVAMQLWVRDGVYAYYHLGAACARGYALRAAYALTHRAIEHFAQGGCEQADLGAGAGADPRGDDGLTRFKRGWATGSRPVYLCGRILDRRAYADLARRCATRRPDYFPVYRSGEFA